MRRSMAAELEVEIRRDLGKHNTRRLRRAGRVPAVLYGHGKENVCLAVPTEPLDALVQHGNRLVTLTGALSESAFLREVQWDVWGTHVVHVDFTRISEHEKVEVQVAVELRGEAPGVKEGGVVEHLVHEVEIECPASAIPEKLNVNINHLKLHDSITLAELELPEGATVLRDPATVVVQCVEPVEVPEEELVEAEAGEPEVIGEDKEKQEGEGS
jgi:large subunit ribosomal protein L25